MTPADAAALAAARCGGQRGRDERVRRIGQVGAGITEPPLVAFEEAVASL